MPDSLAIKEIYCFVSNQHVDPYVSPPGVVTIKSKVSDKGKIVLNESLQFIVVTLSQVSANLINFGFELLASDILKEKLLDVL